MNKCYQCESELKVEDNMFYCNDKDCYRYGLSTAFCKQSVTDFVDNFIEDMQEKVKEVR